MKFEILLGMGLLASVGSVSAQQMLCPGTGIPMSQDPGCMTPNMNTAPAQQWPSPNPQPAGYWEKTWGAIAPSPDEGVLGVAVGARSKQEAERLAFADCKAKGGGLCKVDLTYRNQCAVMVVGEKFLNTASAETIEKASEFGVDNCKKKNANCRIYYSACTEPIFHKY